MTRGTVAAAGPSRGHDDPCRGPEDDPYSTARPRLRKNRLGRLCSGRADKKSPPDLGMIREIATGFISVRSPDSA